MRKAMILTFFQSILRFYKGKKNTWQKLLIFIFLVGKKFKCCASRIAVKKATFRCPFRHFQALTVSRYCIVLTINNYFSVPKKSELKRESFSVLCTHVFSIVSTCTKNYLSEYLIKFLIQHSLDTFLFSTNVWTAH